MFRTIKQQLYLLQLENYDLPRYWRTARRTPFIRAKYRQELVWTPKLSAVFTLGIVLQMVTTYLLSKPLLNDAVYLGLFPVAFFFLFLLFSYAHFIFLIAAVLILKPLDLAVKAWIVKEAKAKLKTFQNLKIVAITGSYGKTTMKEALATVLGVKFTVLKTPESVNTPVGISRLILKKLGPSTSSGRPSDVFIVEMGAYHRGDIQALCDIAWPDIAVLTGINEAHLERFGSIENTIGAKFEIVENTRESGLVVLNGDDRRVKENYSKFVGNRRTEFYNISDSKNRSVKTQILGEYIWGVFAACGIIGKELGLSEAEILRGVENLRPVPHRLERIENPAAGITVIDDSYNGNPDGVREAIKVLSSFSGRRKVYVTPGLVEMGSRTREIHNEIGKQLVGVADIVILIRNSVTPYIEEGMRGSKKSEVVYFNSTQEAHNSLSNILKSGDVVMFQNDWPDNYL